MAERTGLPAALETLGVADQPPVEPASQMDLIAELGLPEVTAAKARYQLAEPRGPGRPAGSRNRRTVAWVDYLLQRYASPLEGLVAMAAMPIAELANRLNCSALEAAGERRLAAIAALPYLHQRTPVAIAVERRDVIRMVIHEGLADVDGEVEDVDLAAPVAVARALLEPEQNQALSEDDDAPV